MALPWALEPCDVSEPVAQVGPAAAAPLPVAAGDEGSLLSEPHAASASVAVSAMPAMRPCRLRFTAVPSSGMYRLPLPGGDTRKPDACRRLERTLRGAGKHTSGGE